MNDPITNQPFTTEDADRILGLGDQFLEDWEDDDGKDAESAANCAERRAEWDAIRSVLVEAPAMAALLQATVARWGEAVENDEPINGGDAVDWLSGFIKAAAALVEPAEPALVELSTGQNQYHVSWEIGVWANNPREAAEKAVATQQDENSTATVFAVTDEAGDEVTIDLLEDEYRPAPAAPKLGGPS